MGLTRDFDQLLNLLKAGVPNALGQLIEECKDWLVRIGEAYASGPIRWRIDFEEVVLSVFLEVSQDLANGRLDVRDGHHLKSLLCLRMRWECSRQIDKLCRGKRDYRRECVLPPSRADIETPWEGFSHEATPEEAAILADTVDYLMRCLKKKRDQTILQHHLDGASPTEISVSIGCSAKMVSRVLQRVQNRIRHDWALTSRLKDRPEARPQERVLTISQPEPVPPPTQQLS